MVSIVKMGSDVEIRTIEIENLHMESSEVRGSVERLMEIGIIKSTTVEPWSTKIIKVR